MRENNRTDCVVSSQLEIRNISKTFVTGRPVLRNVSLAIASGEICALAGANGSGKSTLVQILAGYHHPDDEGEILVAGKQLELPVNPSEARRLGVRFVHQDNGFIAGMSVFDNMCLGRGYESGLGWKINWKAERESLLRDLGRHNVLIDLDADAKTLSAADKAQLAIIRTMHLRKGEVLNVLVLDEPTAAMGKGEVTGLCRWLRRLASVEGIGVLYIGHRPQELREVADTISVLRNGQIVANFESDSATDEGIVEALVGSSIDSFYPVRDSSRKSESAALVADQIKGGTVSDISLSLFPGEIVGITGLQGSGFEDLPYLLFDRERRGAGSISIQGRRVNTSEMKVSELNAMGMVLVPNDRVRNSVVTSLSIRENISQPRLSTFVHAGRLSSQLESDDAAKVARSFGVTPVDIETKVGSLSGGNQQKVVMGKWLSTSPNVILLHEPTEGIDVISKREIFRILLEKARDGAAILISSVEYEDLAHICNRVLICGNGRIHSELAGEISGEDLVRASYAANVAGGTGREHITAWDV